MAEKNVVKGYIHDVSPVKRSVQSQKPYFNMQIQTETDLIRGVCFSPARQLEFQRTARRTAQCDVQYTPRQQALINRHIDVQRVH